MRKGALSIVVLIGGVAIASAQMIAYGPTRNYVRALQQQNIVPTADSGNPLQPTGFGTEPIVLQGPVPEAETNDKEFQIIRAGHSRQIGNAVMMDGGAEFMYEGYHCFGDTAEGNLDTHIFSLSGNVEVVGKSAVITGQQVTIDFDKKIFHSVKSREDMKPSLVQGQVKADLYGHGDESFGSANENETLYGGITSCDLLRPHYEIDADNIILRPAKRIIFRKAKIKLFGRTILRIPYLSIPLDNRAYQNMPLIGRSTNEGYFVKFNYALPLPGNQELRTHLDLMSALGVGVGADYLYQNKVLNGTLSVYSIQGPGNMLKVTDDHRQQFKWGTLALKLDYEQNNYLVNPGSTMLSSQALLTFPQHGNNLTTLTFQQNLSSTNGFSSSSQDIGVADTRHISSRITATTNLDYQTSGTTYQGITGATTQTTEELNLKEDIQDDLKQAVADFTYQRTIPIGSTAALFGANDETPVVTFSSDSDHLMSSKASQAFPFKTSLSVGQFDDEFGNGQISRDAFDFQFQRPDRSTGPFHSDFSGEFKQGIYSDGTAEYVLNFGDVESYRVGTNTSLNFRYNYLRPYGYSPLAIDTTGSTNLASTDFTYKAGKTFNIGAQTGYDLLRLEQGEAPWQPIGLRMEYQPKNFFLVRAQTTYDTFQEAWSNVRVDLSYKPGATFVSVGAYYDGIAHTWSNINLYLDALKIGKMKIGAILNWNGYSGQFDSQQYSVIYDLHCAEAVFTVENENTGFNAGVTYSFFIRLKAFPFDSNFGAGTRGQPLGTGTGTSY